MDFDETPEERSFRLEARAFLSDHAPPPSEDGSESSIFIIDEAEEHRFVDRGRAWQATKAEHGYAGISWPTEYGGRGGTPIEEGIFREEEESVVSPWLTHNLGFGFAVPPLLRFGTDEQKERFIPPMLRGEAVWCQLFSEPNAGSDLGGVRTSAVRDGGGWIVNGQKVWSSRAHFADWGLLVTRSDAQADKYRGITCFLLDMRSPGVEVRPIRQINGATHFNEVFLTDVWIPNDCLLGAPHEGWSVALATLAGERSLLGAVRGGPPFEEVLALAGLGGHRNDPVLRQELARTFIRQRLIAYLGYRVRTAALHGIEPGPESSVLKLSLANHVTRTGELTLDLLGAAGTLAGADGPDEGRWSFEFLAALAYRIGGGTDEVQRTTIAERVLGLPAEPRVDKGVPFRLIPA